VEKYQQWSDSIHGRMIQLANRKSVVSNPDLPGGPGNAKLWKDDRFYIVEGGIENKVEYTLGNRRVQHYLTMRSNGQIHVLHTAWDVKRQEWFDSKDIVRDAPEKFIQQWNTSCFYCHTTQQVQDVKGFDPQTFEYKTAWVESSAACERCHGPMASHARAAEVGESSKYPSAKPDTSFAKLMVCGQCHWAKTVVATGFDMRKPYFDHYSPGLMHLDDGEVNDPSWWADGRPRRFSNEAAAFFMSGCFQSGKATCMSCHDPHWNRTDGNDALMNKSDQYCINCHVGQKSSSHTNHTVESKGSSCVGCHMPHSVNGVKTTMRDHSMSFPEPENTVRYGIPNACNECHADKAPQWALDNVEKWYPSRSARPRMRATAFTLARKNDIRSVNALIRLTTDSGENAEIRAAAVGYLGRFNSELATRMLIALVGDKEPLVRIEAARGLASVATTGSANALAKLLDDPYRAVRVRAAASLTSPLFPNLTFETETRKSFDKAVDEFRKSLELEGDHPNIQIRLGGLEYTLGNHELSRQAYIRALRLNPQEPEAYVGLALLEMEKGNRTQALRYAQRAASISDKEIYKKFLKKLQIQ